MVSARPAWRKMGQGHGNVRLLSRARPCQVLRLVDAGAVRHVTQFLVASLWPHEDQCLSPGFLKTPDFPDEKTDWSPANMPAVGSAHVATGPLPGLLHCDLLSGRRGSAAMDLWWPANTF